MSDLDTVTQPSEPNSAVEVTSPVASITLPTTPLIETILNLKM